MTDLLTEAREVLSRCRASGVVDLGTWARAHLADLLDELEAQRARVDELAAQRDPADEVLVEGSWFHPADLPKVLGNFMRAASDYAAEAKDMYVRLEKLRADRAEELAAIAAKQRRDAARIAELEHEVGLLEGLMPE